MSGLGIDLLFLKGERKNTPPETTDQTTGSGEWVLIHVGLLFWDGSQSDRKINPLILMGGGD